MPLRLCVNFSSGALPENVNYAVKSSPLLSFLESVPDADARLKAPVTADRKFEEVVKSAQDAVLVLVCQFYCRKKAQEARKDFSLYAFLRLFSTVPVLVY